VVELPLIPAPNDAVGRLIDFGGTLRPGLGGPLLRINRQGNRYAIDVTYPPIPAEDGRIFVARLIRAQREGIRIPMPLLGVDQGLPGPIVVDGAGQSGLSLNARNATPGYQAREGYWVSIEAADGQHFLHNLRGGSTVNLSGDITLQVEPMLRRSFTDGCTINLVEPMIEGLVVGDEATWKMSVDHNYSIAFTIEEAE
jgi:hypothetical protein